MMKCPNCNADVPQGNAFCGKCGGPVPVPQMAPSTMPPVAGPNGLSIKQALIIFAGAAVFIFLLIAANFSSKSDSPEEQAHQKEMDALLSSYRKPQPAASMTDTMSEGERRQANAKRISAQAGRTEAMQRQDEARIAEAARKSKRQAAAQSVAREKKAKAIAGRLRRKHDEVQEVTYYYHPTSPRYVNSRSNISLYFSKSDGLEQPANLRLKIYLVRDRWLFIESYTIKADRQTFTIPVEHFEIERDNDGHGVYEWYDKLLTFNQLTMIKAVIDSKKTILRYNGQQYYHDRVVGSEEKRALKEMLEAFEGQGGTV